MKIKRGVKIKIASKNLTQNKQQAKVYVDAKEQQEDTFYDVVSRVLSILLIN